ncbi:hypothetical protein J113_09550 [Mycobacterium tuberculosis CAS/NITR204]|uniref:Uncharacterized protein n=1 Tax=Mycobacterium tuberculosis CAS/NITR204 TaxID=1310114 RepID=R4MCV7_MYCTX|nr:hypothetical protein J113_09550 [Mycobacterium tuberculosis CAS/NITR204]
MCDFADACVPVVKVLAPRSPDQRIADAHTPTGG